MKTKQMKNRMKALAILLVTAIISVTTLPIIGAKASAPQPIKVYYYSDSTERLDLYNTGIYNIAQGKATTEGVTLNFNQPVLLEGDDMGERYEILSYMYNSNQFSNVQDAYVIFDWSNTPGGWESNYTRRYLTLLDSIFGTLKDNGCKILFISNTDETRYKSYSVFLENVDMHIDCDWNVYFMYDFIKRNFGTESMDGSIILLDRGLSCREIYDDYLINYIKCKKRGENIYHNYYGLGVDRKTARSADYLIADRDTMFCETETGEIREFPSGIDIIISNAYEVSVSPENANAFYENRLMYEDKVYALGTNVLWEYDTATKNWFDFICKIEHDNEADLHKEMLIRGDGTSENLNNFSGGEDGLRKKGTSKTARNNKILEIARAFFAEGLSEDTLLAAYNNWPEMKALNTFKFFLADPYGLNGGYYPIGDGDDEHWFSLTMNGEDYLYYYGLEDDY